MCISIYENYKLNAQVKELLSRTLMVYLQHCHCHCSCIVWSATDYLGHFLALINIQSDADFNFDTQSIWTARKDFKDIKPAHSK